jgi:hypothetical protein
VRQPSKTTLKRKLDKIFSHWVLKRDANENRMGKCITCGKYAHLEAGHFIPRQHTSLRYEPMNVHGQCSYCNRWLHGAQADYYLAVVKMYGEEKVQLMMHKRYGTAHLTTTAYQELIDWYSKDLQHASDNAQSAAIA